MLIRDDFLSFKPNLFEIGGRKYVLDKIRKKKVFFTPEEWVRQFIIEYLVEKLSLSKNLISVEKKVDKKIKIRYDISFLKPNGDAILLMECKSPYHNLSFETLSQVENYSYYKKSEFIGITNGILIFFWDCNSKLPIDFFSLKNYLEKK